MSKPMASPLESLKAYMDLTRLHFFFVWPLLFCSGLFLSFPRYGGFSWLLVGKAALIALLGFEAGFVLNDYVDRELDGRDINPRLTRYWRPFGSRPLISGLVSPGNALTLFLILVAAASALVLTLPYPNSAYVLGIMAYSYAAEYFYQFKKRGQGAPIAQLIGRTDFTLFPVAGYLVNGRPDSVALLYFLFFYPFAQAHLGANDIIDVENDEARGLKTIPLLYGTRGAALWVLLFTVLHAGAAWLFIGVQGTVATYGIIVGLLLLLTANVLILRGKEPSDWLRALPLFHAAMLAYVASMIADFFI
jgi:4-hydroxybenzoate polyprenyltransferase